MSDVNLWVVVGGGVITAAGSAYGLAAKIRDRRSDRRSAGAAIVLTNPEASPVSASSRKCSLQFQVTNRGRRLAVMRSLRLVIDEERETATTRATVPMAEASVRAHRVELAPGVAAYDIRARVFGPSLPPLTFAPHEVESFDVTLVSHVPRWYRFHVECEWYDVDEPTAEHVCTTPDVTVDFPVDQSDPLPDASGTRSTLWT